MEEKQLASQVFQMVMQVDVWKSVCSETFVRNWAPDILLMGVILFYCVFVVSCSSELIQPQVSVANESVNHIAMTEQESVFCFLLQQFKGKGVSILIEDVRKLALSDLDIETMRSSRGKPLIADLDERLLQEFIVRNKAAGAFNGKLGCKLDELLEGRTSFTSAKERKRGNGNGDQGSLTIVTSFSNVAYVDGKAIVFMSWQAGPKAGSGDLYILEMTDSAWKEIDRANVWKS